MICVEKIYVGALYVVSKEELRKRGSFAVKGNNVCYNKGKEFSIAESSINIDILVRMDSFFSNLMLP